MHVHILSDGEFIAIIAFTAIITWLVATAWTKRRMKKTAHIEARKAANLQPLQQENGELRALVERQENRIRALETIATDPAERTARAIDALA